MGASILFVEDNEDLRANATLVLDLEGYSVQSARDGQEAMEILDGGFVPQLIVSDIMMPRMDGYEFFEEVRKKEHLRGIPFIFLTARGSRHDITTGRSLGADDYLVKPFDPDEFLIAVQNKLQRAQEMRAQASQSLVHARKALVQLLSHELRTPLTFVTGGFALLAEELETKGRASGETSDDVRISLDLIQSGTQRLIRLAEQMVLYSEILSGVVEQQIAEKSEEIGLRYLVSDAIDSIAPVGEERAVVFHIDEPEDELMVVGVRDLLLIAIGEVVRNAVQFAPEGSVVTMSSVFDGQFAALTIRDTGQGIEPENQSIIWDVLAQSGRERNEQQGIGMGLPIVKGIISLHGGDVCLFSELGSGTEVTLRIPLAEQG